MRFTDNVLTGFTVGTAGRVDRVMSGRNFRWVAPGEGLLRLRKRVVEGFVAEGHEYGRTTALWSSLPCVGVEFKIDPVKAPGAARGLDGAAVRWNWSVVQDDRESFR